MKVCWQQCLLGAFGVQRLSWYQDKHWPLKTFSVKGGLWRAKVLTLHGMPLPVCLSHSPLDVGGRGHFPHQGSGLSFER